MKIVVGSLNQTKVNAVTALFKDAHVLSETVPSYVSAQPIGDEETKDGAMNRAQNAANLYPGSYGIGLEGGVMFLQEKLYLCNWGALATPQGKIYTASGARIQLPDEFIEPLTNGKELSEVMDDFTQKQGIRHHEGAIGIFTNGEILRHEMFSHVVALLKGQLAYWKN